MAVRSTRTVKLIWHYFLQYTKVRMAYRTDFFISILTTIMGTTAGIAAVWLIFHRAPSIMGWSFDEILFLYGFGMLPLSLFNLLSINLHYFGELYIVQGKFDRVLLRPVPSLVQILFEQFRVESLADLILGVVLIVRLAPRIGLTLDIGAVLFICTATVLGAALYVSVFVGLTAVSFWMEDRVGITPPVYNMMAFGRYPLDIYGTPLKMLLSWVLPFGFAAFYPVGFLLGIIGMGIMAAMLPVVVAVFLAGAIFVWNRGVRNYSSTGS